MIERFILPHRATSMCVFVDSVGGRTFDRLRNVLKADCLGLFVIDERPEDEMDVVWHDDCRVQGIPFRVVMQAATKNDLPCPLRKDAALVGCECQEVKSIIRLDVGKIAFVVAHVALAELCSA
jgi:NADPH:quinone reductase-like Zn-dependent oxidoreductase